MTIIKTKYEKLVCKEGYEYREFFQPVKIGYGNFTITEIGNKELQQALIDFINISQEIDKGSDPQEIIIAFLNQWGTLHDLETTQLPKLLTMNPVFPGQDELMNEKDWYDRSKWTREVLFTLKRGRNKSARNEFLKRNWSALDRYYEDDPFLTPYDVPKNLEEALHVTLRQAFVDNRPLRVCPVCGKYFQRAKQSRTCSNACKQKKSEEKRK